MTISQIPPSIVKAICAVQSTLEAVKKSQYNKHDNYKFSSTDDIYAAITRKMGEVGLVCLGLEDGEPEIKLIDKKTKEGEDVTQQWLKVSYLFVLATEDATWTDPRSRRTVFVQIRGPQTFQSAQSYCEKSFLRSLLKLATGDMDLDSLPEGFEYNPINLKPKLAVALPPAPPPAPLEDAIPEKFTGDEGGNGKFLAELESLLSELGTEEWVRDVWCEHEDRICAMPPADMRKAGEIYGAHLERVEKLNAA